jgi:zinc protease
MPKRARSVASDLKLLEPFWAEEVERTVLPNGLTLILKPDRSAPLVSVQAWVRTGSIHEGDHLGGGLSHFLEHMLFKGTRRRQGREISAVIQAHGGYLNAYTTFDRTVYYADLPGEHAEVGIDLLADIVFNSTLPADEVEKERNVILREIDMGRDDPEQRLGEAIFETAFRCHPYRLPIIGHRDVFAGVSREALVAYYASRYVPNNVVVVIVGDIDLGRMKEAVGRHFGAPPRARLAPAPVAPEPRQLAPRAEHRYEAVELTRAGVGWQVPGLDHPDAPGLELLGLILGNGDSSLLWQEVREKAGLVHVIDVMCWNPGTNGLFYVSFTCEPNKREAAFAAIDGVIARVVRSGIGVARLRKAMRQLVVGEINTRRTMAGQASRLGTAEVVVGDLGFTRAYFSRLKGLSVRELVRLVRQYLAGAGAWTLRRGRAG